MSLPFHMMLCEVRVKQLITNVYLDPDFNEPIEEKSYGSELSLQAQVYIGRYEAQRSTWGGDYPDSQGYLIFKREDLRDQSVTLKKGDLFTGFAEGDGSIQEVNFKIREVVPVAFMPEPLLTMVVFYENEDIGASV